MGIFDFPKDDDDSGFSDLDWQEEEPKEEETKSSEITIKVEEQESSLSVFTKASGVEVPPEKEIILKQYMEATKYGHQAALPMMCKGLKCPCIDICPLYAAEINLPEDKACPVEQALIQQWVASYVASLDIDPNEPENAVDMHMVYEIAGLELLRTRAAAYLSKEGDIIKSQIVGYSPQGQPIHDDKISPALILMEKQAKTMSKLRDSILATRKAQAQIGHISSDLSSRASNLQERATKLVESRRKKNNEEIIEVEFEIKKKDDE